MSELIKAVNHNDIGEVKLLLALGADVNELDDDNRTPLHWAVKRDLKEMAEFLIDNGANINIDKEYYAGYLRMAIRCGRTEIAEFLKQHGVTE